MNNYSTKKSIDCAKFWRFEAIAFKLKSMHFEELAAPCFLIAMPQSSDAQFLHSVVFILEHNQQGSMGIVLNRPSTLSMARFCASQNMLCKKNPKELVFQGGPVQGDRAFILHESTHEGPETEVVQGRLRFSYSLESLKLLTEDPPKHLRVYLGYSGWGPGQLAEEMSLGAWMVTPVSLPLIFSAHHDSMWETALRHAGIEPLLLSYGGDSASAMRTN